MQKPKRLRSDLEDCGQPTVVFARQRRYCPVSKGNPRLLCGVFYKGVRKRTRAVEKKDKKEIKKVSRNESE